MSRLGHFATGSHLWPLQHSVVTHLHILQLAFNKDCQWRSQQWSHRLWSGDAWFSDGIVFAKNVLHIRAAIPYFSLSQIRMKTGGQCETLKEWIKYHRFRMEIPWKSSTAAPGFWEPTLHITIHCLTKKNPLYIEYQGSHANEQFYLDFSGTQNIHQAVKAASSRLEQLIPNASLSELWLIRCINKRLIQ